MYKHKIQMYWKIWFAEIIILMLLRFVFLPLPDESSVHFILFTAYAVATWLALMFINFSMGHSLRDYLEENHHDKWVELTTIPVFGSGFYNGFRMVGFVYSEDELNDHTLFELKQNYKSFMKLTLVVFMTLPPLFVAIMTPWGNI